MIKKGRFAKFSKIKGVKPEVIATAMIFLLACLYVLGMSVRNIVSMLSYDNKRSSQPINSAESNQSYRRTADEVPSQAAEPELPDQNPVQKVRAIVGNYTQINDSDQWYQVGDIVEGQAEILAIEPTQILVEWNDTQSYVPLDYSSIAASGTQTSGGSESVNQQLGGRFNNLTEQQRNQMQGAMIMMQNMQNFWQNLSPEEQTRIQNRMMQMGQTMQNMSAEERTAMQSRMMQMGQRLQSMPEQQRQEAMTRIQQQMQEWMLSDQEGLPDFSVD